MSAATSRLRDLVETDLPAPIDRIVPRRRLHQHFTSDEVKFDKTCVSYNTLLNALGTERARAHIILRYSDSPRPSYAQLQQELGFSNKSAVAFHIDRLVEEGLLARVPGGKAPVLTKAGRICSVYLMAQATGEACFRRLVRSTFGSYTRSGALAVREEARDMDRAYALTREGLRRRGADGGKELERKVSSLKVVRALKVSTTMEAAARICGIQRGALCDRVRTLFNRAKRRLR